MTDRELQEQGVVTLRGEVHSWNGRDQARRAAWGAPGVKDVDDRITVVPQQG